MPGELVTGGDGIALGYVNEPAQTAERFIPDTLTGRAGGRLYRTGDLGRWRPDGVIEFLGRLDDQVKIRGFRIEPGEIEAALLQQAGVAQAVVLARRHIGQRRLVGYVVAASACVLDVATLRSALSRQLPGYMVPSAVVVLERLPLTPNGKLDSDALPEPDLMSSKVHGPPRTVQEEILCSLFAEVLRLDRISIDDNFFELGGHSLLAMRLVSRIRSSLGVEIELRRLFETPSVAGLADFLQRKKTEGGLAAEMIRVPREGAHALTPQQYALWLELKLRSNDSAYNVPITFRVERHLAPDRARSALKRLVASHEVLRARLVEKDGEPRFVLDGEVGTIELEVAGDGAADLHASIRRPFDLARGPLWRAVLHHDPHGVTVLLLVVHHIIIDAASEEVLLREFVAACNNPEAALPIGRYDFLDLANHEREQLATEQVVLERYWARTLADAKLTPQLPPPRLPCAPGEEERACVTRRALPPELTRSISRVRRGAWHDALPYFSRWLPNAASHIHRK